MSLRFCNRLSVIGCRFFCLLFTDYRLPITILLFTVFSSCGNGEGDKLPIASNDSTTPADIRAINEKINSDRGNVDLYFQRAKAYFANKNIQNAISDMKIVLNFDSTKAEYYIFLSDLLFTQNQTRDTRDMLRKAIALDSSNTEALTKYSQLFYLLKKYDTATIFINRSLHFNNANAIAHFQKGMILKEWGDTAKAISSFQSAVEFNQQYYDAYMQLGLLHAIKRNPLAIGFFDNALNIDPKSIEARYGKGKFFQDVADYENALKEYNSILEISPENLEVIFNIGGIHFVQQKYNDALQKYDMIIKRDENFFKGYYGRGRCYEALGEIKKAREDYKRCLSLNPQFELAAIQLDGLDKRGKK